MLYLQENIDDKTTTQSTVDHFLKSLSDEMPGLYLLSLLLTADHAKAERCFIAAVEECLEHDATLITWAGLLTRRLVCKHAIQMIMPVPDHGERLRSATSKRTAALPKNGSFGEILSLGEFERFVFVMSVLEGQSEKDCTALLGCSRRDVLMARALAITRLAQINRTFILANEVAQA